MSEHLMGSCLLKDCLLYTSGIIEYQDVCQWENTAWEVTVGEKRTLFSAIHQGYVETAKEIVNRIFEGCQDIDVMRYAAMELLISCFQYVLNDEIAGIDENLSLIHI